MTPSACTAPYIFAFPICLVANAMVEKGSEVAMLCLCHCRLVLRGVVRRNLHAGDDKKCMPSLLIPNEHTKVVIFPAVICTKVCKARNKEANHFIPKKLDNQIIFTNDLKEGPYPVYTFNPNSSAVDQGFFDEWFCK